MYINKKSNHSSILQQLPKSISRRISGISSNENIFNQSIPCHKKKLEKEWIQCLLKYSPTHNQDENNQQREQWIQSTVSSQHESNCRKVIHLTSTYRFPKARKFPKIFNSNTVKLRYYCMKNMGSIISSHNKPILQPYNENYRCNYGGRNKAIC